MSGTHVLHCWRQPCTDCPNRFVSNDRILGIDAIRQRASKLLADYIQSTLRLALIGSFADANDCNQSGSPCGLGLGANSVIAFMMVGPAFE